MLLFILVFAIAAHAQVQVTQVSFESGGQNIPAERYLPAGAGPFPGVLLLHGADGPGPGYRGYATWLAEQGYATFLVHYHAVAEAPRAAAELRHKMPLWLRVASDAITWMGKQPQVKSKRIGVVGFSQGGYVAVGAGLREGRIRAVVEYFGGLPGVPLDNVLRMPPTLILHGAADKIIPVSEAYNLQKVLSSAGVFYDMKIYSGAGHGFAPNDRDDARRRTLAFLQRHLR